MAPTTATCHPHVPRRPIIGSQPGASRTPSGAGGAGRAPPGPNPPARSPGSAAIGNRADHGPRPPYQARGPVHHAPTAWNVDRSPVKPRLTRRRSFSDDRRADDVEPQGNLHRIPHSSKHRVPSRFQEERAVSDDFAQSTRTATTSREPLTVASGIPIRGPGEDRQLNA